MAFAITTNHGQSSGATFSIGTAQNVGDLMIVGAGNFSGTETISVISDSFGTNYSNFRVASGGNTYVLIWGWLAGTGANTMTLTWSAGSANVTEYAEFTGSSAVAAVLESPGKSATGTGTSVTTPVITTVGNGDLVVNFIYCPGGVTAFAFGGSWSTANVQTTSSGLGYQANIAPGAYAPSATWTTSSAWGSLCLAFTAPNAFTPRRMPIGA